MKLLFAVTTATVLLCCLIAETNCQEPNDQQVQCFINFLQTSPTDARVRNIESSCANVDISNLMNVCRSSSCVEAVQPISKTCGYDIKAGKSLSSASTGILCNH